MIVFFKSSKLFPTVREGQNILSHCARGSKHVIFLRQIIPRHTRTLAPQLLHTHALSPPLLYRAKGQQPRESPHFCIRDQRFAQTSAAGTQSGEQTATSTCLILRVKGEKGRGSVIRAYMYAIITAVSEFHNRLSHPMQALATLLGTVSIRLCAGSLADGAVSGATKSVGRVVSSRYVAAVQEVSPSDLQAQTFLRDCVALASSRKP